MKGNQQGVKLSPSLANFLARMAEEREKKAQEEHRRQAQIERDL
jgi:hypothetical protein